VQQQAGHLLLKLGGGGDTDRSHSSHASVWCAMLRQMSVLENAGASTRLLLLPSTLIACAIHATRHSPKRTQHVAPQQRKPHCAYLFSLYSRVTLFGASFSLPSSTAI
jgi:hypothetical protein